MADNVKDLVGIKVGDLFMRYGGGWTPRLEKAICEKITPKQATVGGVKYWIESGREVGRDSYSRRGSLLLWDGKAYNADQKELKIENIRYKLSDIKWKTIPAESVLKIWEIIGQTTKG